MFVAVFAFSWLLWNFIILSKLLRCVLSFFLIIKFETQFVLRYNVTFQCKVLRKELFLKKLN